jgi:hypothetical protein
VIPARATAARASATTSGCTSTLTTGVPVIRAISAALYPVPAPISSTRSPGRRSSAASIRAISEGCELELLGQPSRQWVTSAASE